MTCPPGSRTFGCEDDVSPPPADRRIPYIVLVPQQPGLVRAGWNGDAVPAVLNSPSEALSHIRVMNSRSEVLITGLSSGYEHG
jgi:hypothetical protein